MAVIEAGLGGRYDATNVIPSRVQVLTGVGLEHTRWLGPTVTDVAEEKLAVVRDHATLVVGELDPEATAVAERVVRARAARVVHAPREDPRVARRAAGESREVAAPIRRAAGGSQESVALPRRAIGECEVPALPLRAAGEFQRRNFAVAAAAAEAFLERPLDPDAVRSAAARTHVPGRMDVVDERPLTIHDGAHNPAGARALAEALPEIVGERHPLVLVMSVLEDKDAASMLAALLPLADQLVLTRCSNPRALSPATLETLATKLGANSTEIVPDPRRALARGRGLAGTDGAAVATGSIYLVADLTREPGRRRASRL